VDVDTDIPIEAVELLIAFTDGTTVTVKEYTATGSLARPMTDAALREKFDALRDTVSRRSI